MCRLEKWPSEREAANGPSREHTRKNRKKKRRSVTRARSGLQITVALSVVVSVVVSVVGSVVVWVVVVSDHGNHNHIYSVNLTVIPWCDLTGAQPDPPTAP